MMRCVWAALVIPALVSGCVSSAYAQNISTESADIASDTASVSDGIHAIVRNVASHGAGIRLKNSSRSNRSLQYQVAFVDALLRFALPVTVRTDVDEGPLYDPDTQEIWMPYNFAAQIEWLFDDDAAVADVYFHTLLHEVGHVLFNQYDLPLLSREEDAVDAMADILILEYVENGDSVVLNAADMFGLEFESDGWMDQWLEESDFSGVHSLEIQRYYSSLCRVYGDDPDKHSQLVDEQTGLPEERASGCEDEYQRLRQNWLHILAPYLKH